MSHPERLKFSQRIRDILLHSPTEFAELLIGFWLMVTGAFIAIPFFNVFYNFKGEWQAGLLILMIGFLHLDLILKGEKEARKLGNIFSAMGWFMIFGLCLNSDSAIEVGTAGYLLMSLASGFLFYRVDNI